MFGRTKTVLSRNRQMSTKLGMSRLTNLIGAILYPVAKPLIDGLFVKMINGADRVHVGPFEVVNLSKEKVEPHIPKLLHAVELIETYDPIRTGTVQKGIRLLVIVDPPIKAQYFHVSKAVVIRDKILEILPPDSLASLLVHEATHARIRRMGIAYNPVIKERVERICTRSQVWFLEKVPGAEELARVTREDLFSNY